MWEYMKRNMTMRQIVLLGFLVVIGLIFFIIGLFNIPYILTGKADDLNEIIASGDEPKKLDIVELDVKYVLGWYAETETGYRSIRTSKYHCIVMLEDGSVISLAVKDKEDMKYINSLISYTNSILSGYTAREPEPLHITGVVTNIPSSVKGYYMDGLNAIGVDGNNIYMLEIDTGKSRVALSVALIIGISLIASGIIYLKNCIKEKKYKKEQFATVGLGSLDPLAVVRQNSVNNAEQNYIEPNDLEAENLDKINLSNSNVNSDAVIKDEETKNEGSISKFTLKKD